LPFQANAQTAVQLVQITAIDYQNFPDVSVQAVIRNANRDPIPVSDLADIELLEDGVVVSDPDEYRYQYEQITAGIEILFVLDIGAGITSNDTVSRKTRLSEMQSIVQLLLDLTSPEDRVGLLLVRGDQVSAPIPLTRDIGKARQELDTIIEQISASPPNSAAYSSGLDGILQGIETLSQSSNNGRLVQGLVFISSGLQQGTTTDLSNALDRVGAAQIPVHTVLLRANEVTDAADWGTPLQQLAQRSGGSYAHYANTTSLSNLRSWMEAQRVQYRFQFRSKSNISSQRTIELRFNRAAGNMITDNMTYQVELSPPVVVIETPANNQEFQRVADYGQDPNTVEPTSMDIRAYVEWPDGYPRVILGAQLWVNGEMTGQPIPFPGDVIAFNLDLKPYRQGNTGLQLQVQVQDELQFESFSAPTEVNVAFIELPAPPTEEAGEGPSRVIPLTPCQDLAGIQRWLCESNNYAGWAGLGLGLIAVAMVIVFRRPLARAGGAMVEGVRQTVARLTQRPHAAAVGAYLEVLRGDEQLKDRPIEVYVDTITPIGRSPEDAEIVFQADMEKSVVSRLHCQLIHEDGVFRIRDAGSTHGTYVNGVRLPEGHEGQPLHDGDRIELGQAARGGVMLRFRYAENMDDEDIYITNPTSYEDSEDEEYP